MKNATVTVPENMISTEFVTDIVTKALQAGASDAEAVFSEGDEFETLVRLGQVEQLKEAGSRALGLRVFQGNRTASTTTSDLTAEGIEKLISGAMALVQVTSEDPFAGLPEPEEFGKLAAISIFIMTMCIRCLRRNGLNMRGARKRRRWLPMCAFKTPAAEVSMPQPDAKYWRTRAGLSGKCGARPAPLRRSRLHSPRWRDAARLLVFQPTIAWRCWIRRSLWDWKRRGERCENWGRAKFPRSGFRWCLRRRLPTRFWARSWARSMEMRSIAAPHFWPESWAKRWRAAT